MYIHEHELGNNMYCFYYNIMWTKLGTFLPHTQQMLLGHDFQYHKDLVAIAGVLVS